MRVLITGAEGFIGRAVREALAAGGLGDARGLSLRTLDLHPPAAPGAAPATDAAFAAVQVQVGDASDPAVLRQALAGGVDCVFALGATLTTDAERDYGRGLTVNLHGMLHLLEGLRQQAQDTGRVARLVYTSSIAAFGGPLPDAVGDDQVLTPQTSYGMQKAVNELLINDHARRALVDGRVLRLPIVVTRPAGAAPSVSDRVAALIREPLAGRDVDCPFEPDTVLPLASVQAVARALVRLAGLPASAFGHTRVLNLPSCSTTVAALVDAVAAWPPNHSGAPAPRGNTHWRPDAGLQAIVQAWPRRLVSARADALGIAADASVQALIAQHLAANAGGPPSRTA